jgi:hypothetical protein
MISFATSRGGVKGTVFPVYLIGAAGLAVFAPAGPVLDDPIRQGLFETDVPSGFFRFNPFVPENFFALGLKLPIQRGVLEQIIRGR